MKLNEETKPARTLRIILLITGAIILGGCAGPRATSPKEAEPDFKQTYMRIGHPREAITSLEIAVRGFKPEKGRGPTIWLAGASHIGESNYFAALQKCLDGQTLVLYEGVGAKSLTNKADLALEDSLQHTLATSLGLMFQLSAIDYDRPHFQNSDLSVAQLQDLLRNSGQDGTPADPEAGEAFAELLQAMDGSSWMGTLLRAGLGLLASSPKLQAMSKLVLIETLGQIHGDLSQLSRVPPGLQRLLVVIIQERNKLVVEDLKAALPKARPGDSIAVFYGAGHMVDLEKRLRVELGYRPRKETWLTAMTVDTRQAGLSETEIDALRGFIRSQLEMLQP